MAMSNMHITYTGEINDDDGRLFVCQSQIHVHFSKKKNKMNSVETCFNLWKKIMSELIKEDVKKFKCCNDINMKEKRRNNVISIFNIYKCNAMQSALQLHLLTYTTI